jgi:cbb3-type cytochrome oxidase subunit 3
MSELFFGEGALAFYASAGVVMFFSFFAGVILWTLTRSKKEARNWASIPLDADDASPRTPRERLSAQTSELPQSVESKGCCGDCQNSSTGCNNHVERQHAAH